MRLAEVLGLVIGSLLLGWLALGIYLRRGEQRSDAPGRRTLATFDDLRAAAPGAAPDERPPGEKLARELAGAIQRAGLPTGEVGPGDTGGWSFNAGELYAPSGDVEVVADTQHGEHSWVVMVRDPSSGGPGPAEIADRLHAAIAGTDGLTNVRWHRRELFLRGDRTEAAPRPSDSEEGPR